MYEAFFKDPRAKAVFSTEGQLPGTVRGAWRALVAIPPGSGLKRQANESEQSWFGIGNCRAFDAATPADAAKQALEFLRVYDAEIVPKLKTAS